MSISFQSVERNTARYEEIFHNAGLLKVNVYYCKSPTWPVMVVRNGERRASMDGVVDEVDFWIGGGYQYLVIEDIRPGVALVRVCLCTRYGSVSYPRGGIQLLLSCEEGDKVSVTRVPWNTKSIDEAKEFAAKYRFPDHLVGLCRETKRKKPFYVSIA